MGRRFGSSQQAPQASFFLPTATRGRLERDRRPACPTPDGAPSVSSDDRQAGIHRSLRLPDRCGEKRLPHRLRGRGTPLRSGPGKRLLGDRAPHQHRLVAGRRGAARRCQTARARARMGRRPPGAWKECAQDVHGKRLCDEPSATQDQSTHAPTCGRGAEAISVASSLGASRSRRRIAGSATLARWRFGGQVSYSESRSAHGAEYNGKTRTWIACARGPPTELPKRGGAL